MENEFMKRGYLLPEGCKDLMDVWMPKKPKHSSMVQSTLTGMMEKHLAEIEKIWTTLPPIKEEIMIPRQISLSQLAQILAEKSFESEPKNVGPEASCQVGMFRFKPYAPLVFRDLMKMGKKATDELDFETVSKILGKYGVSCKLVAP